MALKPRNPNWRRLTTTPSIKGQPISQTGRPFRKTTKGITGSALGEVTRILCPRGILERHVKANLKLLKPGTFKRFQLKTRPIASVRKALVRDLEFSSRETTKSWLSGFRWISFIAIPSL